MLQRLQKVPSNPIVAFGLARVQKRREDEIKGCEAGVNANDFLSRFLKATREDPSVPPFALPAWTTSNVTAGSDTTAILLRSTFHYLLTNPESMRKLVSELDDAAAKGVLSHPVSWKESRTLPFLDAVIREAGRLHPSFGLPLERVVPETGAAILGKHLERGTIVGMSAWVVHRDKDTFGQDCHIWRPERWLEADESRKKVMEKALLIVSPVSISDSSSDSGADNHSVWKRQARLSG